MEELSRQMEELKALILQLLNKPQPQAPDSWSKDKVNASAEKFQQMKKARSEWLKDDDLEKYLPGGDHRSGSFIRKEFEFNNWIKDGYHYLYAKKDIIELGKELKERDVNLEVYMDYTYSQKEFEKKIVALGDKKKVKPGKAYRLLDDVRNFQSEPVPTPDINLIKADLERLQKEFLDGKLGQYVDVFKNSYAMMKSMYWYNKYLDDKIRKTCRKWIDDFNYASNAWQKATNKKSDKFNIVHEDDMLEL